MQANKLPLRHTLAAIRSYKTKRTGNFFSLIQAAQDDARDAIGWNPAFLKIAERKAGRELSAAENDTFNFCYNRAVSDAVNVIINRVYPAIPAGIRNCSAFKSWK